jgi:hypothetical protein
MMPPVSVILAQKPKFDALAFQKTRAASPWTEEKGSERLNSL